MPIKASDIQKKLPEGGKKNCKECGFPTCFAFAMKLAGGGISVDKCPHLPVEVKVELAEAVAPPIKLVTFGTGDNVLSIGEEEVVFRHEKTFYRQPGIAILISDKNPTSVVQEKINKLLTYHYERVGLLFKPDIAVLKYESGDKTKYLNLAIEIAQKGLPIIVMADDPTVLTEAKNLLINYKPLLYAITSDNLKVMLPTLKEKPVPVVVKANSVEEAIPLTIRLKEEGITEIIVDTQPADLNSAIADYTVIRRAALKNGYRPLGYPILSLLPLTASTLDEEVMLAASLVVKYASIIVLSDFQKESLFPLLVLRQNIYSDPRVPLTVEEKIYEIGVINEESPALVTTNFALTYFAVASEVEGSKIPAYLFVRNTEGLCVLAAWSTGKFAGETIAPFIKSSGLENKLKHKRLIIPGLVARIKGELEDELPGWEIIVGPKAAEDLPAFLPRMIEKWKAKGA
ncbi:MAG: Corrinoid/iron-sulfur protein large subunit [candidate division WS2 bacterium]|uniref:Corrinoid/iron-sulfur protein large subunit n=1 Tax=Psychracetigena formicireducens TaxID=2986056 RepID=A0A9E2F1P2_PSYF1|nr:Corrinoid/iron-sulfur protein large subunit [Candidatus Psychracetigena formicireducens]MBT9144912.1 Corrinoid/iron-sulfur protein large subunit [Candidatus Psychracetigena formicireducens]MBT9150014.1 Corrinoid/iron-sulfur protein large subunit [Candidatus Psychracetigena formicireducens]